VSFVIQIRQRARGNATRGMVAWALVMTVVMCAWEVSPAWDGRAVVGGAVATALFGAYLGWQRRAAAVFVAPLVSWGVAWLPLWISAVVRHGFVKGVFVGFFLVTVGWLLVGAMEFATLGAAALAVRSFRGGGPRDLEPDVVVFGPDERF